MHGVDVWDQIRKDFGIDLAHRTAKWTVRIFEICWSMLMTQGYNLYRYNNNAVPQRKVSSHQFKLQIILGRLNHQVVTGPQAPPAIRATERVLHQWPNGSRKIARGQNDNRRFRSDCRHCPRSLPDGSKNYNRHTTYYCSCCMVGLHPDCFLQFHEGMPESFRPRKRLNVGQFGADQDVAV